MKNVLKKAPPFMTITSNIMKLGTDFRTVSSSWVLDILRNYYYSNFFWKIMVFQKSHFWWYFQVLIFSWYCGNFCNFSFQWLRRHVEALNVKISSSDCAHFPRIRRKSLVHLLFGEVVHVRHHFKKNLFKDVSFSTCS